MKAYLKIKNDHFGKFYTKCTLRKKDYERLQDMYEIITDITKLKPLPIIVKRFGNHPFIGTTKDNWVIAYKNFPTYYIAKSLMDVIYKFILLKLNKLQFNEL